MKLRVRELKGISKSVGLIGKKEVFPVMFMTRFGIHTFGLKFPIDVLILDRSNMVVCLHENLKPNRIFIWNPRFKKVLELPGGFIRKEKIKKGDKLNLAYSQ